MKKIAPVVMSAAVAMTKSIESEMKLYITKM